MLGANNNDRSQQQCQDPTTMIGQTTTIEPTTMLATDNNDRSQQQCYELN